MNARTFAHRVGNDQVDLLQAFLDVLNASKADYCIIGGLAVNAYAEPVVSLDLDIAIATANMPELIQQLKEKFILKEFAHSFNITSPKSDFRIQIQTDVRYQEFIPRASLQKVLGYELRVADILDVFSGKIWAYQDETRRASKRHKDLMDLSRLTEIKPELRALLPENIKNKLI